MCPASSGPEDATLARIVFLVQPSLLGGSEVGTRTHLSLQCVGIDDGRTSFLRLWVVANVNCSEIDGFGWFHVKRYQY